MADFRLSDLPTCGAELRRAGSEARSLEDVARRIVHTLRDRFVNPSTARPSFVLARFFNSVPYGRLGTALQAHTKSLLGDRSPSREMKCLTLVASVGDSPEWNSPLDSRRHRVIPLPTATVLEGTPMLAALIGQFGFDLGDFIQPHSDPEIIIARQQTSYNVFHVREARGSRHIPDQEGFVAPYAVRSVVGFGGVLPPDDLFAIVAFSRDPISRPTAEKFKPLALSAKVAVLPFVDGQKLD